jgi:hypothetical protein
MKYKQVTDIIPLSIFITHLERVIAFSKISFLIKKVLFDLMHFSKFTES